MYMKIRRKTWLSVFFLLLFLLFALLCTAYFTYTNNKESNTRKNIQIVATTTMIADLAVQLTGETADVLCLMGTGQDPHDYQASAGDVAKLRNADLILYHGLNLEGKMADVLQNLTEQGKSIVCIGSGISPQNLLYAEEGTAVIDPHIWYDVALWKEAAVYLEANLAALYPQHKAQYADSLSAYAAELDALDAYARQQFAQIPPAQRILITAHDAFQYLGNAYGLTVRGLQGVSTEAEAGTLDIRLLADYIVDYQIKAIFVETSIPRKTIESLQAAVTARGFAVEIGGALYSDSLGSAETDSETYIKTFRKNIDTIVNGLS